MHNDSVLIQMLISAEAGGNASWREYSGRSQEEWQRFKSTETLTSLGRDIDVIETNDGYAELITYAGLKVPIVISAMRNYLVTKSLRLIIAQHDMGATIQDVADMARQRVLALIAEGLVKAGYEELAVRAHLRSLLQRRAIMPMSVVRAWRPPSVISDLVLSYYGVLHEMGHCVSVPQPLAGDLSKAGIEEIMREDNESNIEETVLPHVKDRIPELASKLEDFRSEVISRMDGKRVYEETVADTFAVGALIEVGLLDRPSLFTTDEDADMAADLVIECYLFCNIVAGLERSRRLTLLATIPSADRDWYQYVADIWPTAYRIKNVLRYIAMNYAKLSGGLTSERYEYWRETILDTIEPYRPIIQGMDDGLTAARQAILDESHSIADLKKYAARVRDAYPVVAEETEGFVAFAKNKTSSKGLLESLLS